MIQSALTFGILPMSDHAALQRSVFEAASALRVPDRRRLRRVPKTSPSLFAAQCAFRDDSIGDTDPDAAHGMRGRRTHSLVERVDVGNQLLGALVSRLAKRQKPKTPSTAFAQAISTQHAPTCKKRIRRACPTRSSVHRQTPLDIPTRQITRPQFFGC